MVSDHTEVLDHDEEEGEQFIDSNKVLEEVPNDEKSVFAVSAHPTEPLVVAGG